MSLALLRSLRQSILKPWLASPSSTQHTQWHIPQAEREEEEEEAEEEGGGEHQNREKGEKECGCFPYEMLGGSPLILNEGSTARDYMARERNFLSWIKLAITLFIISTALLLRFQFGGERTVVYIPPFEIEADGPLGILFFVAAAASLLVGFFGYFSLQNAMQRRDGFVSSGPISAAVVWSIGGLTISACVILLVANR